MTGRAQDRAQKERERQLILKQKSIYKWSFYKMKKTLLLASVACLVAAKC